MVSTLQGVVPLGTYNRINQAMGNGSQNILHSLASFTEYVFGVSIKWTCLSKAVYNCFSDFDNSSGRSLGQALRYGSLQPREADRTRRAKVPQLPPLTRQCI